MTTEISPHVLLSEPQLAFSPTDSSSWEIHPLRGLLKYGPFSDDLISSPIRVATLAPHGESNHLFDFMRRLHKAYGPRERRDYLPEWPGFQEVFGVRVEAARTECRIELDREFEAEFRDSLQPHIVLADHLVRSIQQLQLHRHEFEVLFIYLPRRWNSGFVGSSNEDFDLHDYLKATTAALGLPIQLVREDSAIIYHCQASVMWRIGVALYAKAGGVPWKLAEADPETAHIGISYSLRSLESDSPRFITCCSQVFDPDGAGLEFIAYEAHDFEVHRQNPFLSRLEMFRVMTRSMDLYRRRHAGKPPQKVVVHKTTEFKPEEVAGCMEALHLCESVDLVQVIEDVNWRGVRIDPGSGGALKGRAARFPVSRGTAIGISPREALVWTHGDVKNIGSQGSYFKGSRGTPRPLKLVRHAGHGPWDESVRAILGLTKMNWNNDSLYDSLPVTLAYAKVLARVMKRITNLRRTPYQFRFFM